MRCGESNDRLKKGPARLRRGLPFTLELSAPHSNTGWGYGEDVGRASAERHQGVRGSAGMNCFGDPVLFTC
jgi:hypothetical protein